jgi:hypothetical protein
MSTLPQTCDQCGTQFVYVTFLAMPDDGEPILCDLCDKEEPTLDRV